MSLTAENLKPCAVQRRTLNPCIVSFSARVFRSDEEIDHMLSAPIDDRSDRSPVDIVEPATDQPEALCGEVHDGGCDVDALPLMGLVLFLPSFASDMCVPAGDRGGAIIALPVKR
jgi:hypothetical protein